MWIATECTNVRSTSQKATVATKKRRIAVIFAAFWLTAVAIGMSMVISFSNTAGAIGKPLSEWPFDCPIQRAVERNTLLMFIHPRCPCSRASLRELAEILAQAGDGLEANVLFFQPVDEPDNWSHTDLWETATHIPGVKVKSDLGAATASQFGAETSGHVLLYDAKGRLLFSGGITAGRGHEGDNSGHSAVVSLVQGKAHLLNSCPIFGCPVVESD
ncbi:MAG: hypothetical protein SGJ19_03815 [Planctomycetia bacterium]|nr:hypothetical protein [Planctomycetia bacterium]